MGLLWALFFDHHVLLHIFLVINLAKRKMFFERITRYGDLGETTFHTPIENLKYISKIGFLVAVYIDVPRVTIKLDHSIIFDNVFLQNKRKDCKTSAILPCLCCINYLLLSKSSNLS